MFDNSSRGFKFEIYTQEHECIFESDLCLNIENGNEVHFIEEELEIEVPSSDQFIIIHFIEQYAGEEVHSVNQSHQGKAVHSYYNTEVINEEVMSTFRIDLFEEYIIGKKRHA